MDDNALRQEFLQKYGDDFAQELRNALEKCTEKAFAENNLT